MAYQKPKGTADILPGESERWQYVEEVARQLFDAYRFKEIRTPVFESYDVFARSVGDTSDIVTKEMYDFHDKGDRHITLRPEGTAGVIRSYVENKLYGPEFAKPYKAYYMESMFRYERPQSGRMRQFHQIGVEAIGSENPAIDAEVIAMALDLLDQYGLNNLKLVINSLGNTASRDAYRAALIAYLEPHLEELSNDSKTRLHKNPLRVLDSKDAKDQEIVKDAPSILDYLDEESQKYFDTLKAMLNALDIEFEIDATMVRGLDYYSHTIFEIMSDHKAFKGQWTTVCAGGRYDGLVEELGGPATPSFGFGLGVERLLLVLEDILKDEDLDSPLDVYVVGIGEQSNIETLKMVQAIRAMGYSADRDFLSRSAKAQFKTANRLKAAVVLTVGESELEEKVTRMKVMATGKEEVISLEDFYDGFQEIYEEKMYEVFEAGKEE